LIHRPSLRSPMTGPETSTGLDPIQEAIRLFNDRYFFEAHEVLEEVWRQEHGESRLFLQGLIQVCAAYHHFQNGNLIGAITLLERGADKMRRYPGRYLGFDSAGLIGNIDRNRKRVQEIQRGESGANNGLEFPRIERQVE
jgi:predicted metal-dependent hydrolase